MREIGRGARVVATPPGRCSILAWLGDGGVTEGDLEDVVATGSPSP